METVKEELALVPPKVEVVKSLVFKVEDQEVNTAILTKKKEEALLIKINGLEDKEGLETATKLRRELVTTRTTLEKFRKDKSKPHQDFCSELKKITDGYGAICKDGEKHLDAEIKKIEELKAKEKEKKELEKQRLMQERIAELFKNGATFDGSSTYSFPHDTNLLINTVQLKDFDADEFGDFMMDVTLSYEKEQNRIADEKRKKEDETASLINKAAEITLTSSKLNEKALNLRLKELKLMGLAQDEGGDYYYPGGNSFGYVKQEDVQGMDDNAWDAKMLTISDYIETGEWPEDAPAKKGKVAVSKPASTGGFAGDDDDVLDKLDNQLVHNGSSITSSLHFNSEYPFKDVDISAKFRLRFFPQEFAGVVISELDPEVIVSQEAVDPASNLRFLLLKR